MFLAPGCLRLLDEQAFTECCYRFDSYVDLIGFKTSPCLPANLLENSSEESAMARARTISSQEEDLVEGGCTDFRLSLSQDLQREEHRLDDLIGFIKASPCLPTNLLEQEENQVIDLQEEQKEDFEGLQQEENHVIDLWQDEDRLEALWQDLQQEEDPPDEDRGEDPQRNCLRQFDLQREEHLFEDLRHEIYLLEDDVWTEYDIAAEFVSASSGTTNSLQTVQCRLSLPVLALQTHYKP
jgi:hypothetical protein